MKGRVNALIGGQLVGGYLGEMCLWKAQPGVELGLFCMGRPFWLLISCQSRTGATPLRRNGCEVCRWEYPLNANPFTVNAGSRQLQI